MKNGHNEKGVDSRRPSNVKRIKKLKNPEENRTDKVIILILKKYNVRTMFISED